MIDVWKWVVITWMWVEFDFPFIFKLISKFGSIYVFCGIYNLLDMLSKGEKITPPTWIRLHECTCSFSSCPLVFLFPFYCKQTQVNFAQLCIYPINFTWLHFLNLWWTESQTVTGPHWPMLADYYHLWPSETGGGGWRKKWRVAGEERGSTWVQGAQPHQFGVRCTVVPVTLKSLLLAQNIAAPPGFTEGTISTRTFFASL